MPEEYKSELEKYYFSKLALKVHYLPQKGIGLTDWNEKVYSFASKL